MSNNHGWPIHFVFIFIDDNFDRILASLPSSGKLDGSGVKTSALVSRSLWISFPSESTVDVISHRHSAGTENTGASYILRIRR